MLSTIDPLHLQSLLGATAGRLYLQCLERVDSTNSELLRRTDAPVGTVIIAERQDQGRGRRGRHWVSDPGHSLCFSLLWRLPMASIAGLSLLVGLALAEALESLARGSLVERRVALKWPNDLMLVGGKLPVGKLGGVLIELQTESCQVAQTPQATAVIGVGINLGLSPALNMPGLPVATLDEMITSLPKSERILAALLATLVGRLDDFAREGFAPFVDAWQARHVWQTKVLDLYEDAHRADGTTLPLASGRYAGIDDEGALWLNTDSGRRRFKVGDLSLRVAA